MKNVFLILLILFIATLTFAENKGQNRSAEQGRALHQEILSETPDLDILFQGPDMLRPLTPAPTICIYVPISAWENLKQHEKTLLAEYVSSLIPRAKEAPQAFVKLRKKTATTKRIERNAQNMTKESWEIIAGDISKDGNRIENTRTVLSGK